MKIDWVQRYRESITLIEEEVCRGFLKARSPAMAKARAQALAEYDKREEPTYTTFGAPVVGWMMDRKGK